MALILYPDGSTKEVFPANKRKGFSLEELYTIIGGYIEIVRPRYARDGFPLMIVDDEGRIKGLPINLEASLMYDPTFTNPIVGTVILANDREVQ